MGLLFAAAFVVGACGSDPAATEPTAAPPLATNATGPSPEPTILAGSTAVLPAVSGGQIDFGDLAGQDALLWFWAPW